MIYPKTLQQSETKGEYSRTLETISPVSYPRSQVPIYHSPRKQQNNDVQNQQTPQSQYRQQNTYKQYQQWQESAQSSGKRQEKQASSRKNNQYTNQNLPTQNLSRLPSGQDYDQIFAKQLEGVFNIHSNSQTPHKGSTRTKLEQEVPQKKQKQQKPQVQLKNVNNNQNNETLSPLQPYNYQKPNFEEKIPVTIDQPKVKQNTIKAQKDTQIQKELNTKDPTKDQAQNLVRAVNQSLYGSNFSVRQSEIKNYYFEKGELIGAGAFGRVYLGLDNNSGKLMAIKQVQIPQDPALRGKVGQQIQELQKEVSMLKKLKHRNIVQYLGTEKTDDCLNFYLEYVPGGSIASLIQKFGSFKESVIKVYSRQILQGLEYLHKNKIIHRDIKGANCLVDNQGTIKLADFGASKDIKSLATLDIDMNAKSLKGTPYWMAPEIIKQNGYGRQADIWSLGCTVFEMATGKPPFSEFNAPYPAMLRIAEAEGPPAFPDQMSEYLKDFITQCMQKLPSKRPTCTELLNHPFLTTNQKPKPNATHKEVNAQRIDSGKKQNTNNIPRPPITPQKPDLLKQTTNNDDTILKQDQIKVSGKPQLQQKQQQSSKKVDSAQYQKYGGIQHKIDKILEESHDQFLQVFNNALENQKNQKQQSQLKTPQGQQILPTMQPKQNQQWTNIPSTRAHHVATLNHTSYNNRYASINNENSIDSYGSPPRTGSTNMPTQTDIGSETLQSNYVNSQLAFQNSNFNAKGQGDHRFSEVDSLSVQPKLSSHDQVNKNMLPHSINDANQDPIDSYTLKNIPNLANLNFASPSLDSGDESYEMSSKKIKFGIQPKVSPKEYKQLIRQEHNLNKHMNTPQNITQNLTKQLCTQDNSAQEPTAGYGHRENLNNVEGTILPSALKPPKPKMNQDLHSPYGKKITQRSKKLQNNQQQDTSSDITKQGLYQSQLDGYEQQVSEEVLLHYVDRKAKKDLVRLSQPFQPTLREKLGLSQEDIDRYIQALQLDEDSPIEYTKEQLHQWRIKNKALSSEQCDILQQYVQQQQIKTQNTKLQQHRLSPKTDSLQAQSNKLKSSSPGEHFNNKVAVDQDIAYNKQTFEYHQHSDESNLIQENLTPSKFNSQKIQTQLNHGPALQDKIQIKQVNQLQNLEHMQKQQQFPAQVQQNQKTSTLQQLGKANSSTETTVSGNSLQKEQTNLPKKGNQKNFIKANKETQGQRTRLQNKKFEKQKNPDLNTQQAKSPLKKR